MKLVLTVLCRDEIDVIKAMLDFHFANGVDQIIATDNGSVDGTFEVLEEYSKSGRLILIREPHYTHEQSFWMTRMAKIAYSKSGADWVINSDADEFWWPTTGTLKNAFARVPPTVDAITVNRSNFLPYPVDEEGSIPFHQRMIVRERVSTNSLGMPLIGKACHRARSDAVIAPGNHAISFSGRIASKFNCSGIEIMHFPVRSYEQYERKIRQGSQALLRNTKRTHNEGRTWLYVYEHFYQHGRLRDYYAGIVPDEEEIQRRVTAGDLIIDERLASFFRGSPLVCPE